MAIYFSAKNYIDSACTLQAKMANIDQIIDALFTCAINSADNTGIDEYFLNDGQTQIRTKYRDTAAIYTSIKNFEALKRYYQRQLTGGRMIRLVDSKNLPMS